MDTAAVKAELDRLVGSPELHGSDRLCRFLRYVVEAKLDGEQDKLKEFLIGREVFDRNGDYDPRLDPIVRVEARRLRKKLDDFYARESPGGAVRILLPKGGYVPEFLPGAKEPVAKVPAIARRRWLIPAVWAASLAEVGCLVYAWRARRPAAAAQALGVAVIPARWIWSGEDFPDIRHDEDLAERIGQKLAAGKALRVVAWPVVQGFRGSGKKPRQMAKELGAERLLVTAVRVESDGFRVTTYVIDAAQDRKLSVRDERSVSLHSPADRDKAAGAIAADLASRLY